MIFTFILLIKTKTNGILPLSSAASAPSIGINLQCVQRWFGGSVGNRGRSAEFVLSSTD
jgi:hypothetical protein